MQGVHPPPQHSSFPGRRGATGRGSSSASSCTRISLARTAPAPCKAGVDLAWCRAMTTARMLAAALAVCAALTVPPALALAQDASKPADPIDTRERIKAPGAIMMVVREASVPFSFVDAQKQPQGYSIDLCLRIADAVKNEL